MSYRSIIIALLVAIIASAVLLHFFSREVSAAWAAFGVHPEIRSSLRAQLGDLRSLARLDPSRAAEYRERFEATRQLLNRAEVLEMNRDVVVARYEQMLLIVIVLLMTLTAATYVLLRRRDERRLAALREAIVALWKGDPAAEQISSGGGDLIARVFSIVGETARVVAGDRRRLSQLDYLASWHESARRLAHEIRNPLTAARLDAERLSVASEGARERIIKSIVEELDVIASFTNRFTSLASVGEPRLEPVVLRDIVADFVDRFANAWPNTSVTIEGDASENAVVRVDREMIRRVLANLCANSALSFTDGSGKVELHVRETSVEVIDDGRGIDPSIIDRLFTPYVTTRPSGEGMGLGLAISKKILLDHGGDLELVATGPRGTHFRFFFPAATP